MRRRLLHQFSNERIGLVQRRQFNRLGVTTKRTRGSRGSLAVGGGCWSRCRAALPHEHQQGHECGAQYQRDSNPESHGSTRVRVLVRRFEQLVIRDVWHRSPELAASQALDLVYAYLSARAIAASARGPMI